MAPLPRQLCRRRAVLHACGLQGPLLVSIKTTLLMETPGRDELFPAVAHKIGSRKFV
jgi:hypothetical protein